MWQPSPNLHIPQQRLFVYLLSTFLRNQRHLHTKEGQGRAGTKMNKFLRQKKVTPWKPKKTLRQLGRGLYWKPHPENQTRKRTRRRRLAEVEEVIFFLRRFQPPGTNNLPRNRLWEDYSHPEGPKQFQGWELPEIAPKVDFLVPIPDFFAQLPKESSAT